MGRVFGGFVGQSEANLRSVIQTAEAKFTNWTKESQSISHSVHIHLPEQLQAARS